MQARSREVRSSRDRFPVRLWGRCLGRCADALQPPRAARTVAVIAAVALAAALSGCAAVSDGPCGGQLCSSSERCVQDGDGESRCQTRCMASARCPAEAPICDAEQGACRTCSDGEDQRCRDRSPETPRCIAGQCVACASPRDTASESVDCLGQNGQLSSRTGGIYSSSAAALPMAPICDQSVCRPCGRHSECASGVCAKDDSDAAYGIRQGSCVPFDQVLVVDQNLCSRGGPIFCTPQQAIDRLGPMRRYVVLRKGAQASDFTNLTLSALPVLEGLVFHFIGPLADAPPHRADSEPAVTIGGVSGRDGFVVNRGNVVLEGLYVRGNRFGVACQSPSASVRIVRSLFVGNGTAAYAENGCQLSIIDSWFGRGPSGGLFQDAPHNGRSVEIGSADFQIINSVFTDNGDYGRDAFGGVRIRALTPGSSRRSLVMNSTFFHQTGLLKSGKYYTTIYCDNPIGDRLVLVNTLLSTEMALIKAPEERYIDASCGAALHNIASNDDSLSNSSSVVYGAVAPLFVDMAGRDLRLSRGQSTDQKALETRGTLTVTIGTDTLRAPDHDLDGKPRPTDHVAIGAFEPTSPLPR